MRRIFQIIGAKPDAHAVLVGQVAVELTAKAESTTPDYSEAIGVDYEKKSDKSVIRVAADVEASNDTHPNSWSARIAAGAQTGGHFKGSKVMVAEGLAKGPQRIAIQWAAPDGGMNRADPTLGPSTPEGMSLLVEEIELTP